jgi:hypothetical protein
VAIEAFERDWEKRWLVERGIEIISEASRHLDDDMKDRRPEVPWSKVAGIGNILRHAYDHVAADVHGRSCTTIYLLWIEFAARNSWDARARTEGLMSNFVRPVPPAIVTDLIYGSFIPHSAAAFPLFAGLLASACFK